MPDKPDNSEDVFLVMKSYSETKGLVFSDTELRIMAEKCYLTFESKGWSGCKYWPPLAMRWVLSNGTNVKVSKAFQKTKSKRDKTVREIILEREKDEV